MDARFLVRKAPTVFIDNLPHQIHKIWVFNLFSRYGKIKDIFIPNKRSKVGGQSFGFMRYFKYDDAALAVVKMNKLWIWNHSLQVKFAKILRKEDNHGFQGSMQENRHRSSPHLAAKLRTEKTQNVKRRKEVWRRKGIVSEQKGKEIWRMEGVVETSKQGEARNVRAHNNAVKVFDESPERRYSNGNAIKIQSVGNGWLLRSAIAKIRRLLSPRDLETVLLKEGIQNIQVRTIGGRYVIITFSDALVRDAATKLDWISIWFEEFKPWEGEQAKQERFVWISCIGMPLNGWSVPNFREIGNKWGHFLQVDDSTLKLKSFQKARILISTDKSQRIEESIMLSMEEKLYVVRVEEEDSFRVIKHSLSTITNFERDHEPVENDDMDDDDEFRDVEQKRHEMELIDGMGENNSVKGNNNVEGGPNVIREINNKLQICSDDVQIINDKAAAINSSSEFEASAVGNARANDSEKVEDSFDEANNTFNNIEETKPVGSDYQEQNINSEGLEIFQAGDETFLQKQINKSEINNEQEEFESFHTKDGYEELNEDQTVGNNTQVQAAIKSAKGKKKRKSIDEILGLSKAQQCYQRKGKSKSKCVFLRSAVAAAALSTKLSSQGINNRNRILLDEAQAIRELNKLNNIGYDGEEDEVISKLVDMEALRNSRAVCHP